MIVLADLTATATLSLAGATFALVLVTLLLAEITRRGSRDARQGTQDTLRAEARALTVSYRPVIVPYQRSGEKLVYRGGEVEAGRGPLVKSSGAFPYMLVPVENVGNGTALNLRGRCEISGTKAEAKVEIPLESVAAGDKGAVTLESRSGGNLEFTSAQTVTIWITCNDIGGEELTRRFTFNPLENAYTDAHFTDLPERRQSDDKQAQDERIEATSVLERVIKISLLKFSGVLRRAALASEGRFTGRR